MKSNLGIDEKSRKAVADMLNSLLADEYVLYTKTYNYHWNVQSSHFHDLHKTLEEQYTQLADIADEVAERVRSLGFHSFGTLTEFLKHTQLKETPGVLPIAQDMLKNLLHDHETIIRSIRDAMNIVTEGNDYGTESFLGMLLEKHEKTAWMLRASIEV